MIDLDTIGVININFNDYKDRKIFDLRNKKINLKTKNFNFETLYIPNEHSNELLVLLCSGGRKTDDTRFDRWSMYGYTNKNILCVEDPMYKLYPKLNTGWYYGDSEHSIVDELKDLIHKLLDDRKIISKDVCFIGSSCGGHAALHLAYLVKGASCIAMNPQIVISNWAGRKSVRFLSEISGSKLSNDDDKFRRNDLSYIVEDNNSKYFIMANRLAKADWDGQVAVLFDKLKPINISGLNNVYVKNNFIFYLSDIYYTRPHTNSITSPTLLLLSNIVCSEDINYTAIQSLMHIQEKIWEVGDNFVNYDFWNRLIQNIHLGSYFLVPTLDKKQINFTTYDKRLTLTLLGEKKNTVLRFVITCNTDTLLSSVSSNIMSDDCLKFLEATNYKAHKRVIQFSVYGKLRIKFIYVLSVLERCLLTEYNTAIPKVISSNIG